MALKYQFNKTFQNQLNKELKVRVNALPTLQAKESALRAVVKIAREEVARIEEKLKAAKNAIGMTERLFAEFPKGLVVVSAVRTSVKKIAGVKTPVLEGVDFEARQLPLFSTPAWFPWGIDRLKDLLSLEAEKEVAVRKQVALEYARKKTTQKVNLYEKVQIPEYQQAILKIKRFLEDEENLAKSSQKILKEKMLREEAA
jgi:V/A-type H+-transporting ATPase subunit D